MANGGHPPTTDGDKKKAAGKTGAAKAAGKPKPRPTRQGTKK